MPIDPTPARKTRSPGRLGRTLALTGAWAWAIAAGGGGFLLLLEKGPLPLTNGWFALLSGVSACPLTAWLLKKFAGLAVPGRARFFAAAFFFVAGRMALLLGMRPSA
jgi:hypothetical protein